MAEISTFFINLPADRIDSEIEVVQRRICEFLDLDRSSLFQADDDCMQSYFEIDAADAARSGLSTFDADAGFKDVGLNLTASYKL